MASLIITNVISSSAEVSYNYLETDELFGYTIVGSYVVDISDINLQQNDTTLLKGRDAIKSAYGRPNLVARIGADDYINGQIQSYSFSESTLVGSETVTLSIRENRRLDSYASTKFAKYIPNPHNIESFEETYSFNREGGNYSSQRNISLSYNSEAGDLFLEDAKTFLTNYYFGNRPSLGYQEDGISEDGKIDKNYRGNISESYDLINLSVQLTEEVNSSFIDDALKVGRNQTENIEITKEGYKNKTHNISLTSLRKDSENVLTSAISQIIEDTKNFEQSEFGKPFSISKGITKDGQEATLTIFFTTDPKKNQDNIESYSGSQSKAGKFDEFSLNIEYKSNGKNNRDKFFNSKKTWIDGQTLNKERIRRLFHPSVEFYEKSRSTKFEKSRGFISESIVFTTDDSYKENDDGVLKFKKTLSKTHQINRLEKFLDLSTLEDRVVVNNKRTIGGASVTAELVASQSMGLYEAKEALERKTDEFTDLVDEDITHITSDEVSLNLGDGTARRSIQYIFRSNG
jgi:hypothetical protein|tara:strand:+ start:14147 stop:15697 length:1551 start_codon:yes stop_codon:yes gene_type:complete